MIDTIVLLLNTNMYQISEPDKFIPSARWALRNSSWQPGIKSKQNPTKQELLSGIYKPRLTSNMFDRRVLLLYEKALQDDKISFKDDAP